MTGQSISLEEVLRLDVQQLLNLLRRINSNKVLKLAPVTAATQPKATPLSTEMPVSKSLPLSFEQEAIWLDLQMLLAEKHQSTDPYSINFSVLLKGKVEVDKLRNGIALMLQR